MWDPVKSRMPPDISMFKCQSVCLVQKPGSQVLGPQQTGISLLAILFLALTSRTERCTLTVPVRSSGDCAFEDK